MAEAPKTIELKLIHFEKDKTRVELGDHRQLYDVNPQGDTSQVDYYVEEPPGRERRFVLLSSAPPSVAARLLKQPAGRRSHVRTVRADASQEREAVRSFQRGREFGEREVSHFAEVIRNWDGSIKLVMNEPQAVHFHYRDPQGRERTATLSVRTRIREGGSAEHRFFEVRLNADGVRIVIDRPEILRLIQQQPRLAADYKALLKVHAAESRRQERRPSQDIK